MIYGNLSLVLLLVFVCVFPTILGSEVKSRKNYGIIFKPETKVQFSNDVWLHTFSVQLPNILQLPHIEDCEKHYSCQKFSHVFKELNIIKTKCQTRLKTTLDYITSLLPQSQLKAENSKSKRAPLGFIGDLSKTIFGTATIDDVRILAQHVNALTSNINRVTRVLSQHGKHQSSFTKAVTRRIQNLRNGVQNNHEAIMNISKALKTDIASLENSIDLLPSYLVNQLQMAEDLEYSLEQFKLGIVSLVQGQLSPLLISHSTLLSTVHFVHTLLTEKYKGMHVSQTDTNFYYSQSSFVYARTNSTLYVTLRIPLTTFKFPFTLYQIISLPVPINNTSKHATQLLDIPSHIAISHNKEYFVTMAESDVKSCIGQAQKHCFRSMAYSHTTERTCVMALFHNEKEMVLKECNFRFVQDKLSPQFIELEDSSVLVYNSMSIILKCNGQEKVIAGCNFCVMKIPCACSLTTSSLYLPARLTGCHNITHREIKYIYPVNLALLQHFFHPSTLTSTFGDTTFPQAAKLVIPDFRLYNHSMSKILANDQQDHLNLERMVNAAKKDEAIFQSLSEPLITGDLMIPSSINTYNIISIVSLVVSGLSCVVMIWMFCKIRTLSTALIMAGQMNKIQGTTNNSPVFIYQPEIGSSTSAQPSLYDYIKDSISWEHGIFLLTLISTLFIIYTVIKLVCKQRSGCKLYLEITSGGSCVMVQVVSLSLCPSYWQISAPISMTKFRVTGILQPQLALKWSGFHIINRLTNQHMKIRPRFKLGIFQARKLRTILMQPFCTYLVQVHHNFSQTLYPDQALLETDNKQDDSTPLQHHLAITDSEDC